MGMPGRIEGSPSNIVNAAPNAAPLEIPRVKGSANGLRNIACSTTPHNANPPPAKKAVIVRGNLKEKNICRCKESWATLIGSRICMPIKGAKHSTDKEMIVRAKILL